MWEANCRRYPVINLSPFNPFWTRLTFLSRRSPARPAASARAAVRRPAPTVRAADRRLRGTHRCLGKVRRAYERRCAFTFLKWHREVLQGRGVGVKRASRFRANDDRKKADPGSQAGMTVSGYAASAGSTVNRNPIALRMDRIVSNDGFPSSPSAL